MPVNGAAPTAPGGGVDAPDLRVAVFALFFVFGGITSLNDVLIPKLKELFTLDYAEVMLVQSAFFAAYLLVSLPAAEVVKRVGYLRTATLGLVLMTAGCVLFVPASSSALFATFLGALFVLAAGITVVQVVANPLISLLGPAATVHSRLTFAQAFNSLGTTVFPFVGSVLILGSLGPGSAATLEGAALAAYRVRESHVIATAYLGLAAVLAVVAAAVWRRRDRLRGGGEAGGGSVFGLLRRTRFRRGAACIFLYVGAEVAIGSLLINFLMQPGVWGVGAQDAGKHVPFYWGGAMLGRFVGAGVLRRVPPGAVLAGAAAGALVLLLTASAASGAASGWALLGVGVFNSIMFPTIFALASEGLGDQAAEGSGIICMAIVGGAVVPPLVGHVADASGSLKLALAVPAACYLAIAGFGLYARRPAPS
jgi:FHS family L-fucose permease-like MFS transporter